jgi:hypothetical protein
MANGGETSAQGDDKIGTFRKARLGRFQVAQALLPVRFSGLILARDLVLERAFDIGTALDIGPGYLRSLQKRTGRSACAT